MFQGILFEKNGNLRNIDTNKAAYDALQYPLIFPTGQLGWEPNTIKLTLKDKPFKKKKLNPLEGIKKNFVTQSICHYLINQLKIDDSEQDVENDKSIRLDTSDNELNHETDSKSSQDKTIKQMKFLLIVLNHCPNILRSRF